MGLVEILTENKITIAEKWLDAVLSSYHEDSVGFFKKQKDRFANPLGYSAKVGLEKIVNQFCAGQAIEVSSELSQFVKLRAVQTFTPSQAVSFVYELKKIVVAVCGADKIAGAVTEWLVFEGALDALAMKVFDLYMENRELLCQIKINEFKTGNHVLANGKCPSAMLKENKEEKIELRVIQDC